MVTTTATSLFFPAGFSFPTSSKTSMMLGGGSDKLGASGIKSKPTSSGGLQVKVNVQDNPKINGTMVTLKNEDEDETPLPPLRNFINQLPDMLIDPFVQEELIFSQNFSIRSYEIGPDQTASIETLMNLLQETALNHVRNIGLLNDGFGSTPEMSRRNLIWVVTRMQVLVDRYPSWGDVVLVDSWVSASGKNGMRRDWLVRDSKTGETLTRATSIWVMMNKQTRKLSKMPEEVRREIEPQFIDCAPILNEDSRKLPKLNDNTLDYVRTGLSPGWNDLDANQHVNNVKYVGWILESAPVSIWESHELSGMTLEYKRECGRHSMLQSLTAVSGDITGDLLDAFRVECQHLLRLESGSMVMRGRTEWKPNMPITWGAWV
ncbi:hypothetical protein HHK36_033234 [Tetracentron sinense]|uniref:Acyl-[acyl-carrier-protein] hydrolase n=1 Tax=Tetracentron sinense TaxID=13715 RepID=A0A834Y6D2_TETSI|nr:hypothetical protein HHK36_033234 [Tetracentron sinense]